MSAPWESSLCFLPSCQIWLYGYEVATGDEPYNFKRIKIKDRVRIANSGVILRELMSGIHKRESNGAVQLDLM